MGALGCILNISMRSRRLGGRGKGGGGKRGGRGESQEGEGRGNACTKDSLASDWLSYSLSVNIMSD